MAGPGSVGFFGKLPGMGDFVQRRLPVAFVSAWDAGFEAAVATAHAEFRDQWRAVWQSGPVWRFALTPGVCGALAWVGVTGPSVDRVGRCFPMVLACPLTDVRTFGRIVQTGGGWFDALERACRGAEATPTAELFDTAVAALATPADWLTTVAAARPVPTDWTPAEVWRMPWQPASDDHPLAAWLAACVHANRGCLWWTHGGARMPACVLLTSGLPQPQDYPAFLDAARTPRGWRTHGVLGAAPESAPFAPGPVAAGTAFGDPDDTLDELLRGVGGDTGGADRIPPDVARVGSALPLTTDPLAFASRAGNSAPAVAPVAASLAHRSVVLRQTGAVTLLAADNGQPDGRRQAAAWIAAALSGLVLQAGVQQWRERLLALHPGLCERSEDLINPIPEDGAAVIAGVMAGQAALLRIGAASAWHWRRGQLRPLFADAMPDVPRADSGTVGIDDLVGMPPDPRLRPMIGLGAAGELRCDAVNCFVEPRDRLILLATDMALRVSAESLAAALAAAAPEQVRAHIAAAAGLGTDCRQWPVAVMEVGA